MTDKDEQRIVLKEATGATRVVPVASIEDQKAGGSLMPKGLANLMTHAEFVDLVRFLSELGKPGPYAIRPVPAIQRWRGLEGDSGFLARADCPRQRSSLRGEHRTARKVGAGLCQGRRLAAAGRGQAKAKTGGELIYLQGAVDVSAAGPIKFAADSAAGVRLWIDKRPLAGCSSERAACGRPAFDHGAGRYLRAAIAHDRVEVIKPPARRPSSRSWAVANPAKVWHPGFGLSLMLSAPAETWFFDIPLQPKYLRVSLE